LTLLTAFLFFNRDGKDAIFKVCGWNLGINLARHAMERSKELDEHSTWWNSWLSFSPFSRSRFLITFNG